MSITFDVNAVAEGICNSAPGSTIDILLDLLNELIGEPGNSSVAEGSLVMDAYYYRRGESDDDTDDEDEIADNEIADGYLLIGDQLLKLRDAIAEREETMNEDDDPNVAAELRKQLLEQQCGSTIDYEYNGEAYSIVRVGPANWSVWYDGDRSDNQVINDIIETIFGDPEDGYIETVKQVDRTGWISVGMAVCFRAGDEARYRPGSTDLAVQTVEAIGIDSDGDYWVRLVGDERKLWQWSEMLEPMPDSTDNN